MADKQTTSTEGRGLLTDAERAALAGDRSDSYRYKTRSYLKRRIEKVERDAEVLAEHAPDLLDDLRAAVDAADTRSPRDGRDPAEERLNEQAKSDTFDVSELEGNPNDTLDDDMADKDPIGDVLIGWEPSTDANAEIARAQTRRTAEHLQDHAPERFKKSEIQNALAGDSTLNKSHWWEHAVRPGIRQLAEAEPPLVEYRVEYHDYQWVADSEE